MEYSNISNETRKGLGTFITGVILISLGLLDRSGFLDLPGSVWLNKALSIPLGSGCRQSGAILILVGIFRFYMGRTGRQELIRRLHLSILAGSVTLAMGLVAGEAVLRIYFWEGMSFGAHYGPIVQRFERDFEYNRFHSRGPAVPERKRTGGVHILMQGDSITWGQGIKVESSVYTHQALEYLRRRNPNVEMATIAEPGRDIDWHFEQLKKWGESVSPDAILYQWYFNDIRAGRRDCRPADNSITWRRWFFLSSFLVRQSYLFFFLDSEIPRLLPHRSQSLSAFLFNDQRSQGPCWRQFAATFKQWAKTAKEISPRVMILLYATGEDEYEGALGQAFLNLATTSDIVVVDLTPIMRTLAPDYTLSRASAYDGHPGERAHELIAEVVDLALWREWPELFTIGSSTQ